MELIELIVANVKPPSKIIKGFTEEELEIICSVLDLNITKKEQMQKELLDFKRAGDIANEIRKERLISFADNVISKLRELVLDKNRINSQEDAVNEIGACLSKYFRNIVFQCNLRSSPGVKIDLDINDGKFGIEVKRADSFLKNTSELFRVFGQAIYCTRKKYRGNFLVVVVGTENELQECIIREAMSLFGSINIKCLGIVMK